MLFLSVARGVEGEGVEGEGAASRVTFSRIYIESQVGVALNQDFIRIKLRFSLGTTTPSNGGKVPRGVLSQPRATTISASARRPAPRGRSWHLCLHSLSHAAFLPQPTPRKLKDIGVGRCFIIQSPRTQNPLFNVPVTDSPYLGRRSWVRRHRHAELSCVAEYRTATERRCVVNAMYGLDPRSMSGNTKLPVKTVQRTLGLPLHCVIKYALECCLTHH